MSTGVYVHVRSTDVTWVCMCANADTEVSLCSFYVLRAKRERNVYILNGYFFDRAS